MKLTCAYMQSPIEEPTVGNSSTVLQVSRYVTFGAVCGETQQ